jgi:hypothetical protein
VYLRLPTYLFNLDDYGNVYYEGEHYIDVYVLVIFRARVGSAVKSTAIALTNWLKSQEHGIQTEPD